MINFEYIKTLPLDEFKEVVKTGCSRCAYDNLKDCRDYEECSCSKGYGMWLEMERDDNE